MQTNVTLHLQGNCEMHGIYIKIHSIQISPVKDIQTCIHGIYTIIVRLDICYSFHYLLLCLLLFLIMHIKNRILMKSHDTISYFHYEQKPTCHFEHYDFSKNKRKHNFFQIVFYE